MKVNFLLDATLGMISIEQNTIIKIFSVAAVAFLPPTLVAIDLRHELRGHARTAWAFGYPLALADGAFRGGLVLDLQGPWLALTGALLLKASCSVTRTERPAAPPLPDEPQLVLVVRRQVEQALGVRLRRGGRAPLLLAPRA